jgi:cytoskeletal protein CcmA (bactofilin family)
VEGTIDSTGTLTIGEHARIRGEIRTKSVKVRGTVEGNIFVTDAASSRRAARCVVTLKRPG